jgi:phospholipid/cholesterol/gamma-HCH transport system ATP-binding protein
MAQNNASYSLSPDLVINFVNVTKSFEAQNVCSGINLAVKRGQVLSILGPSGCGKTVSIKMLIGLILPDDGAIYYDGLDLVQLRYEDQFLPIRKKISMVFQGAALFDSMTVFENIAYPLIEHKNYAESEIEDKVAMTLGLVGLPDTQGKMPEELSGGMKKRIGLARAIITNPEVILYDEPTAGLDPINTRRIVDLILMLQEKLSCTSIVVTHDMPAAQIISQELAFMFAGKVRQIGSFQDLWDSEDAIVRGFVRGDPTLLLSSQGTI